MKAAERGDAEETPEKRRPVPCEQIAGPLFRRFARDHIKHAFHGGRGGAAAVAWLGAVKGVGENVYL